jgi:hypothetical protein
MATDPPAVFEARGVSRLNRASASAALSRYNPRATARAAGNGDSMSRRAGKLPTPASVLGNLQSAPLVTKF